MKKDEKELLERLRKGENSAYQEILNSYGSMLLGYATRILGSRDDAEEAIQEAIVSIFDHIHRFEGRCSIRSWLFRIVHHKAVDHLRRNSRFVSSDANPVEGSFTAFGKWNQPVYSWDNSPEARVNARKMLALVREKINKLPHNYRQILLLREIYQLETTEICEVLEVSSVHMRVMLHRARQALYQSIDDHLKHEAETS
mgnify:CR=1 FL=1